ncbi:hypoxanthine phosphoribosyltransferase [Granulicatella sp. zg-ZJ]|uniref:hypoxanthine phosphoribosyltransferase n=1 Tax=unclassified Granulicatella TaxID=2630493 RepID=UPI0013C08AF8|nr:MULTISPECIES: hypoxanthine phosphoribosyltransferase [unclassified Granulicatella]MBS4750193.1 hypoxanthine phosphoribosyltransferase [Carnobacteriaceae bacterium zg-ZUI78]NEW63314.1 hypoxanthine phosphoribosyltransferase [Granulicatella sp. zg-ZJ]NEW66263.1 hypoxanthine phosphoribosyltransferase [Granulicatella sp. zg-84]QMI85648.1 hypoxanthine phosphoribosyltransferase [Carnobacteriaceae bacterium zg-84]
MIHEDIEKVLVTKEELEECVKRLGEQLSAEYDGKKPLIVGVLRGCIMFMTDLVRNMSIPLELDFIDVSSYGDETESSGYVKILKDLDTSVEGRHLILIEDIVDTGRTLMKLKELFEYRKAESIKVVTLLDKPERRVVSLDADYVGIEIPNEFVVGYGLDYAQLYRNLPYIGVLKESVYSEKD